MVLTRDKFSCSAARVSGGVSPNDGQRSGNIVRAKLNEEGCSLNAVGLGPVAED